MISPLPDGTPFSRIGFGGAAIGLANYIGRYDAGSIENRAAAVQAIRVALDEGITYFDTAPGYGNGLSETLFGEALAGETRPHVLATKVPLSRAGSVRASLEESLRRLGRSRVDLLQIHGGSFTPDLVDRVLKSGGMADEMDALRAEGLVRDIGFTSEDNNAGTFALIESGRFESMQISYNLLLQHPYEPTRPFGSLFDAKKRGLTISTMRTATSGIFQRWVQMVNPANTFDYSEALIQFVVSNPLVDVALVGIRDESMARSCGRLLRDETGRIDVDALWNRYV